MNMDSPTKKITILSICYYWLVYHGYIYHPVVFE